MEHDRAVAFQFRENGDARGSRVRTRETSIGMHGIGHEIRAAAEILYYRATTANRFLQTSSSFFLSITTRI